MVNPNLPPENWMVRMAPLVMLMGVMLALAGLVTALVLGANTDYAVRHPGGETDRTVQAVGAWVMPLTLNGVAFVLVAITIFLRGIFKGIRFMGGNVTEAVVRYVGTSNPASSPASAAARPVERRARQAASN